MSEGSKPTEVPKAPERTLQDIQNQYTSLCNKAGHIQYQVATFKRDLDLINSSLRDLNFEATALQTKQAQKAAEEALAKNQAEKAAASPAALPTAEEKPKKAKKMKEEVPNVQ